MKCIPSEHTLKNGSVIIARSLCAADAEQALAHRVRVCGESDNLSRYPDEIRITPEEERTILQKQEENPKGILLGAFVENQLVAMASVLPVSDSHERYRHRGGRCPQAESSQGQHRLHPRRTGRNGNLAGGIR